MTSNSKALMLTGVAVLSWSTVATAFKTSLKYFTHYEMLTVASVTALLIFTALMTVERRWGELRRLSRSQWGSLALLGLVNPTAYYLIMFSAYNLLPAQVAQPVNYCWPIILAVLLAVFTNRPISRRKYFGMTVSLAGLAIISSGGSGITGDELSPVGLLYAIASAGLWAFYWLMNNRYGDTISESVRLFVGFFFGVIYLFAGLLFVETDFSSVPGLLSSVYVGAFEIGIPFICFGLALRLTTNVALVNQLCYLAPFMSLFFISMILHETIVPTTYVGLVLIVGGLVYNQYFADRPGERIAQN